MRRIFVFLALITVFLVFSGCSAEEKSVSENQTLAEPNCTGKGMKAFAASPDCCSGLVAVSDCLPGEPCPVSIKYCVQCGNSVCEERENWYNCPEDCSEECVSAGMETNAAEPNCCAGLVPVSPCIPGEPCPISLRFCVNCSNGICENRENRHNCPSDCAEEV